MEDELPSIIVLCAFIHLELKPLFDYYNADPLGGRQDVSFSLS